MQIGSMELRKFSRASVILAVIGLVCIVLLKHIDLGEPKMERITAFFVLIPICVILTSVLAVSLLEPIVISIVLFVIAFFYYLYPDRQDYLSDIPFYLQFLAAVIILFLPTTALGYIVLFLTRGIRAGRLSWSFLRGIAWGIPCGVGAMFALKSKMSYEIAFRHNYSMVWLILGIFVVISGIMGIKRSNQSVNLASQDGPADDEPPLT